MIDDQIFQNPFSLKFCVYEVYFVSVESELYLSRAFPYNCTETCLLTCVQPALERQATFLDIIRKVVDVEGAGSHHLDRLIVANKPVMTYIDVRNVRRLSYIHTAENKESDYKGLL